MSRAILIAIACLGAWLPSARAVDWNVKSILTQRGEFNDNRRMLVTPPGNSYNSVSDLVVDARALTPTSRLELSGNLAYRAYSGEGEANTLNALDNGFSAKFDKSTKLTNYNLLFTRREIETATIQLEETGQATLAGSTITTTVGGGLKHTFNPRDSIAWQTTLTSTDFTLQNSTPFTRLSSSLSWTHNVSPISILTPSLQIQRLRFDNAAESEVTFVQATMGGQTELTKRLRLSAGAGGSWLNSEQKNNAATATNPAGLPSGSALDWVANMQLTYKPTSTVVVALTAARTVGPTTLGQFLTSNTVNMAIVYNINQASNLTVSGAFTNQASTRSSPSDVVSAIAAYSHRLAREWRTQLTYRFLQRNSSTGTARSNAVLISLSHDVTILP